MASEVDVIRGDVRECLANAHKLLLETLVVIDGTAGWRQFLRESSLVGTFGTACGLIAYCKVAPDDGATVARVATSLAKSQLADGAWASPTIAPGVGLATATCYATLALLAAGLGSSAPELQRAATWLCDMIGADDGVGHAKLDPSSYLVCTALTLRTLTALDQTKFATQIERLIGWFSRAQNSDGGFGETRGSPSTIHHTAEAIIALGNTPGVLSGVREQLKGAGRYLDEKRSLGQNKHKDVAYIKSGDREVMLPHTYQSDGLQLQAEMSLKAAGLYQRATETAQYLIQHQKNGFWIHDAVPGKIPAWGIMECVVGLTHFLCSIAAEANASLPTTALVKCKAPEGVMAIGTEWASGHGGLSTFNRELCKALAKKGERVVCLVPSATSQEVKEAETVGVKLISAPRSHGKISTELLFRRPLVPEGFMPRIVIGHGRITGPYAAAQVSDYFENSRRIHFVHMIPDEIEWHKDKADAAETAEFRTREELRLCQGAGLVVAVGPRIMRETGSLVYGTQPPVKVHRLDPGLQDVFAPDDPPPGIQCLVLGRAEDLKLKGLDIAVAAVARLPHPHPRPFESEPVLTVRGAPKGTGAELHTKLKEFAGRQLDIRVREFTSNAEHISEDLQRASVVLMPSRTEGFGLVALEALAMRRPILVSDRSGFGELLTEKLGRIEAANFVVRTTGDLADDAAEWGQVLEFTLRDREAAFRRARKLYDFLSPDLSWDKAVSNLLKACDS